jgi:23S rRNA C2498 (ribose-2'-O)-methylase RlmM
MRMIVVDGFKLDPEHQTFECLRCGFIEKPGQTVTAEYRRTARTG